MLTYLYADLYYAEALIICTYLVFKNSFFFIRMKKIFSKTCVLALCALSLNLLIFVYYIMVTTDVKTTEGETR